MTNSNKDKKLSGAEQVAIFMNKLEHPLKEEKLKEVITQWLKVI